MAVDYLSAINKQGNTEKYKKTGARQPQEIHKLASWRAMINKFQQWGNESYSLY